MKTATHNVAAMVTKKTKGSIHKYSLIVYLNGQDNAVTMVTKKTRGLIHKYGVIVCLVVQDNVGAMVIDKTKGSIHKYGVTMYLNGWDNVISQTLINVILACSSGKVFFGSVDTIVEPKDANYMANCIIDYIHVVGQRI